MTAPAATRASRTGGPESWVAIVDDDASLRLALTRALRAQGINVEPFASGEEFLQRLPAGAPECAILDINLPGLSGFDLHDRLVTMNPSLPVIFITGRDDTPTLARVRGAAGYLRKPFETTALMAVLRPHLRLARLT